jgi:GT2 family glycosyltransferase
LTRASVVVVAYMAGAGLTRLLDSLAGEDGLHEVLVVDNGGGGPEIEDARGRDGVRVLEPGGNLGFAAGCNVGAAAAEGDVLVFLNPDTVVSPGAIAQLARTLEDESIGIAMARLRLLDEPDKLNASGVDVHVTGIGWAAGYGDPAESVRELGDVPSASGTAMAIRAETFRELGGFAEELFMYLEDLELGWRARLAGYRVVVDPAADVLHEYEYGRNPRKSYYLERNRLVFLLSAYSGRQLALLAPVLLATELGMLGIAAKEHWLRDKVAGWG